MIVEKDPEIITFKNSTVIYFPKAEFKNGFILAFWSHSPRGCCYNQDRGYIIYDPIKKDIEDSIQVFDGYSTGDYKDWIKDAKELYGKLKYYVRWDGTHPWKIEE